MRGSHHELSGAEGSRSRELEVWLSLDDLLGVFQEQKTRPPWLEC